VREDSDQNFIDKNLVVPGDSDGINELIENWFFPKSLLAPVGSGRINMPIWISGMHKRNLLRRRSPPYGVELINNLIF
jgi:hypothetical protein